VLNPEESNTKELCINLATPNPQLPKLPDMGQPESLCCVAYFHAEKQLPLQTPTYPRAGIPLGIKAGLEKSDRPGYVVLAILLHTGTKCYATVSDYNKNIMAMQTKVVLSPTETHKLKRALGHIISDSRAVPPHPG